MKGPRGVQRPVRSATAVNDRGTKRRIQRLRARDNTPLGIWLLAAFVMFLLFLVVPWLLLHG
jgi:hypothetical protein